ncbi:Chaperonin 60 subunit beta 3, chloroplastic -like protein [Gossypium arboreum]|uniref:Chaperonin 60 subunit beta 3, chloroplastic-like protein n=1 Tax=Gossypium arboreum TaxID=29729 RepID=A0A0B0PFG1_GOSAR|nr:Chaperonin 60 subunit beta 3, chloroplastic -like protein [Gossypium arboreum]
MSRFGQVEGIVALTAHRTGLHPGTRYLARGINSCFSTADANLVLTTRGIEKTTRALVSELKAISKEGI